MNTKTIRNKTLFVALLPFFGGAGLIFPTNLFAQEFDAFTFSLEYQTRAERDLTVNHSQSAATFGYLRDFPALDRRQTRGEIAALEARFPWISETGALELTAQLSYRQLNHRFNQEPFTGVELASENWFNRESYTGLGLLTSAQIPEYYLSNLYPTLFPQVVDRSNISPETLFQRRLAQEVMDFLGVPLFSQVYHRPLRQKNFTLEEAQISLEFNYNLSRNLALIGAISPGLSHEVGATRGSEAILLDGSAGLAYYFGEELTLGIAAGYTHSFGFPTLTPILYFSWKPTENLEVEGALPFSLLAKYWLNEIISLGTGLESDGGAYVLKDKNNFLYTSKVDAYLLLEYQSSERLALYLKPGATLYQDYELYRYNSLLYKYEGTKSYFLTAGLTLIWE